MGRAEPIAGICNFHTNKERTSYLSTFIIIKIYHHRFAKIEVWRARYRLRATFRI